MKELFNWRYYVLYTLFGVGLWSFLFIAAQDNRPLGAWIETRLYLAVIGFACFMALGKLHNKWSREGKVFTKTK